MTPPGPRDPDAWRRVNDVFHQALALDGQARETFLAEACGPDDGLRAQVRSLIAAHTRAGSFLESPTGLVPGAAQPADGPGFPAGHRVGQYRIDRVLGRGGMGVVYLAEDLRLGRRVALKAVSPAYTNDAARRERLRREARAAASLSHPGIATVYALEEFGDEVFIAGEFVAGETLRSEIARGPATPARALDTAIGIATALAAAHDQGIVHRDLKPENVMRTPAGQLKILDFGLARFRDAPAGELRLTDDGHVLGTPAYMAPEQIRRGAVDARADLFALGILLHELLTGSHPFAGGDTASTIAHILESEPARPASASGPADDPDRPVAIALEAVIHTCLRKAPEARFASAHQMLTALEQARRGLVPDGAGAIDPNGLPMRWWKFHQAAASGAYVLLMLPLWGACNLIDGRARLVLFLIGLVAAVTAVVLRLHLWFAVASLPAESREQRVRSRPWLRAAESILVAVLLVAGVSVLNADGGAGVAALLVASAVAVLIAFAIIEPATTRATFGRH